MTNKNVTLTADSEKILEEIFDPHKEHLKEVIADRLRNNDDLCQDEESCGLLCAVVWGLTSFVEAMLEQNQPSTLAELTMNGRNLFHWATLYNQVDIMKVLSAHDTSLLNLQDPRTQDHALNMAVRCQHLEAMQLLLAQDNIAVNISGKDSWTPLYTACFLGFDKGVELLLNHPGIDVNQSSGGDTPLYQAAWKGYDGIVKLLLQQRNIDVNAEENRVDGETALFVAASYGRDKVVQHILEHPAVQVNKVDRTNKATPLHIASQHGHEEVVRFLLTHGEMDVNWVCESNGATPLNMAVSHGHEKVVKLLLAHPDVDVNWAYPLKGLGSLLTSLQIASVMGYAEIVRLLLQHPDTDPNIATSDGDTALNCAGWAGQRTIIEMILQDPRLSRDLLTEWCTKYTAFSHFKIEGQNTDQ